MVSSGLGLFNESVLNERGFDQKTFHDFLVFTTLISLGGQFGCGWLSRRCSYQMLTCVALILYGLGLGLIPVVSRHWQLWAPILDIPRILNSMFRRRGAMVALI